MIKKIFALLILSSSTGHAQSLDFLTGLHPRPQVSYFRSQPSCHFSNAPQRFILIDSNATAGTLRAVAYLQRELRGLLGDTLEVTRDHREIGFGILIIVGDRNESAIQQELIRQSAWFHDSINRAQGYLLDVSSPSILVAGADSDGTFNGISTLVQLLKATKAPTWDIPALHINDWPDYPIRWVFSGHNLLVNSQVTELEGIEDSMAAHKLNGLQQNDFKNNIYSVFENSYPPYFYNVDSLQAYSAKTNVELIPGMFPVGWSEGILFHDPDLAEGFPTRCNYYIESDTGRLVGDPRVSLPHGDFENASDGKFPGWNWYDPTIFVDSTTFHSGRYSARATNFSDTTPNGRFIKLLTCNPHQGYHLSAWYKTQGFQGEFNLMAIGFHGSDSRALTYTQFSVPATTSGWQQANVIFNTLGYDSLYVYCGVWSGTAGTIWMDDFAIEDAGMTNLLRRPSDMPTVTVAGKSENLVEGRDYAMLVDSVMEKAEGTYPWHASPGFTVLPGSPIKHGDTVQVHFIRPNPTINDPTGDGSTMVCVSEDTLYSILHDQLSLVDAQYHAGKYFMSHDEIREMNWDSACQNRKLAPAQLLADNVRKCDSIMHEVHPGAEVFDWSDMFDSLHNAHNNYYLVNGDLSGDWNLIPKDITIVNWNSAYMSQSLSFFSKLGFSQITSPYYDVQNTNNIRAWRLAMDTIPNMRGMMYTTWADDYSFLTPFADYAWSAGPMIVHTPLDSATVFNDYPYPVAANADVFPDPYDPTDSIVSVVLMAHVDAKLLSDTLKETSPNHYQRLVFGAAEVTQAQPKTYWITAKNRQGLSRSTPEYVLNGETAGISVPLEITDDVYLYPNPATNTIIVNKKSRDKAIILIEDMLGRKVTQTETLSNTATLDLRDIPAGIYECIVTDAFGNRNALPFVKE